MLVTSRWTFPVAGLKAHKLGVLPDAEAVDFLLELCPRIKDKAADLAKACAYLPLALRIAGSFLQVNDDWSVEKYLTQLNDRKQRLETFKQSHTDAGLTTTEPYLLATFELSYNQLSEEEQKRWRMLGVFPASFASNAAQALWELEEDETTKLLGLLKRYSLLDYVETSNRYTLHDLLADYALSQMNDVDEQDARLRHAFHYKDMMEVADGLYLKGGDKILLGLELFDLEWEHIRLAQMWISENIAESNDIAKLAMFYPVASVYCLDLRLTPIQQIEWLTAAITAARKLNRKDLEVAHLGNLGNAYYTWGDAKKAIGFHEQALIIAREIGDRYGEGIELFNMGLSLYRLEEKDRAIEFVKRALDIYEAIESPNAE